MDTNGKYHFEFEDHSVKSIYEAITHAFVPGVQPD
jgi:hypothetical protein